MTTEATIKTLDHVWKTLKPLGRPMAVMGGLALAAWKRVRATRDVDLLIDTGNVSHDELIHKLQQAGIRSESPHPLISLGDMELLQLWYEPPETFLDIQVDLFVARTPFQKEALARRVPLPSSELGIEVDVLSREDMILFKLVSGRLMDLADAAELLRANRDSVDLKYLMSWCQRLRLEKTWNDIWQEAFPGEELPTP